MSAYIRAMNLERTCLTSDKIMSVLKLLRFPLSVLVLLFGMLLCYVAFRFWY